MFTDDWAGTGKELDKLFILTTKIFTAECPFLKVVLIS